MHPQRRVINHLAPVSTRCTSFPLVVRIARATPLKGNEDRKEKEKERSLPFPPCSGQPVHDFSVSRNRRREFFRPFRATRPDLLYGVLSSSLFSTEDQPIARSTVVIKMRSSSRRVESSRPPLLPRRGRSTRGGLCKAVLLVVRRWYSFHEIHSRVHLHPLSAGSSILLPNALWNREARVVSLARSRSRPYCRFGRVTIIPVYNR